MVSRRSFLAASLASPFAAGPLGRALAQSTANVDRNGAAYIGELLVYDMLAQNATKRAYDLIQNIQTGWTDLTWQNDMIEAAGVFKAIPPVARKIAPPAQFAGAHKGYLLAFDSYARYGAALRSAIETANTQTMLDAEADLKAGLDQDNQATKTFQQELAAGS